MKIFVHEQSNVICKHCDQHTSYPGAVLLQRRLSRPRPQSMAGVVAQTNGGFDECE
jgi:hypothetical protein